jgi:hypothetical protein
MDMPEHCWQPQHFNTYPHTVIYQFNSRGFRDDEWPQDLDQAIWCLGDSFTVGFGSPREHTWPWLLGEHTLLRTINISMDGASNDWIARRGCQILSAVKPELLVIQWSYTHRRELPIQDTAAEINQRWRQFYQDIRAQHWPNCESFESFSDLPLGIQKEIQQDPYWPTLITADDHNRRLDNPGRDAILNDDLNCENFFENVHRIESAKDRTQIIHTFIPGFTPDSARMHEILEFRMPGLWLPEIRQQDFARDGHHYDIITATCLVDDIINIIS